jgi:Peptidase MA superfamily
MGTAVRGRARARGRRGRAAPRRRIGGVIALVASLLAPTRLHGQSSSSPLELRQGRFLVVADSQDARLARSLLAAAVANDTFPGLARPRALARIEIAPSEKAFEAIVGPGVPEWGVAFAIPREGLVVMRGSWAGSEHGDPLQILRHELAHLALHESMGSLPPRWFDEGYASYAAGELGRDDLLATNLALVLGRIPTLDSLDAGFRSGATQAAATYALAHRAVSDLADLDPQRGLTGLFAAWRATGSLDGALREADLITLDRFEQLWRKRTRWRYGFLAVFADLTILGLFVLVLFGPLLMMRRRQFRQRLATMRAAEEAAERAARRSAIEALLRSLPGQASSGDQETS